MRIFGKYGQFGTGRVNFRPKLRIALPPIVTPGVPPVTPPVTPPEPVVIPVAFVSPEGNIGLAGANAPFTYTFLASGTNPVFELASGTLPAGITLFDDGVFYGTYTGTTSGNVVFSVRVRNSKNTVTRTFSIDVQAAPVWATDPNLGQLQQGESFRRTLTASSTNGPVEGYQLLGPMVRSLSAAGNPLGGSPDLPETLGFDPATGQIGGYYVSQDPEAPVFQTTAGMLGRANRNTPVTYVIKALPGFGRSIVSYSPTGRNVLPAGLQIVTLANGAASITGTVDLYASDLRTPPDTVTPVPTWSANATTLDTLTTFAPGAKSYTISATPNLGTSVTYQLVKGNYLPAGYQMTPAGVISGTLDRINHLRDPFEKFGTMTWETPAGSLGTAKTGTAVSIPLSVTPASGTTVGMIVFKGALPFGTQLTLTNDTVGTATISGTLDGAPGVGSFTAPKTFTFILRVTDSIGGISDREFTYTITP